ncbi:MAG: hypothetical protein GY710_05540 [Desulfobacteraceae bacterium]|nr:hypothetical protein [Desulfobacteraceae bacterium]
MSIFSKLTDIVGGSLFKEVKEGVMAYFPPSMTPQEKATATLNVDKFLHQKFMETNGLLQEAANQLDKRIETQEGTASDLKVIPFLGPVIIFLRGVQRPAWGFYVMYLDYIWFVGSGEAFSEKQDLGLIIINLLVLGFLFGERTVKNLEPLIVRVFGQGKIKV